MKKLIFLILILLTTIGCGLTPEKTVETFLTDVKEKKVDKAMELSNNPDFVKNLEHNFSNDMQKKFFNTLYSNLEFKVLNSVKQQDKSIIVNVEIVNIDVQDLLLKVFQSSLQKTFNGQKDVNIEKEILSILSSGNFKKNKVVDQYVLVRKGRKYKVDVTSKNIDNIFGGYYSSIANISNIGR